MPSGFFPKKPNDRYAVPEHLFDAQCHGRRNPFVWSLAHEPQSRLVDGEGTGRWMRRPFS
jgi:hypothetical protein